MHNAKLFSFQIQKVYFTGVISSIICFYLNQTHFFDFHMLVPTILMEEIYLASFWPFLLCLWM